jgi:transposase
LLSIAAIYEGMSRAETARLGAMDRQTLRDWVHRFNAGGPSGLVDRKAPGAAPRLSGEQKAELAALVEAGPDLETDGVVRWRCIDLKVLIQRRFGVDYHERTIGKLLTRLGFSHISQRPRHYAQNPEDIAAFKCSSSDLI